MSIAHIDKVSLDSGGKELHVAENASTYLLRDSTAKESSRPIVAAITFALLEGKVTFYLFSMFR